MFRSPQLMDFTISILKLRRSQHGNSHPQTFETVSSQHENYTIKYHKFKVFVTKPNFNSSDDLFFNSSFIAVRCWNNVPRERVTIPFKSTIYSHLCLSKKKGLIVLSLWPSPHTWVRDISLLFHLESISEKSLIMFAADLNFLLVLQKIALIPDFSSPRFLFLCM